MEIPRRIRIDRMTPAEMAIRDAVIAVEAVGADTRLTDAVVLLGRARDKVADYVDGVRAPLEVVVRALVKANPDKVEQTRTRPASMVGWWVGQVMKETDAAFDVHVVRLAVYDELFTR